MFFDLICWKLNIGQTNRGSESRKKKKRDLDQDQYCDKKIKKTNNGHLTISRLVYFFRFNGLGLGLGRSAGLEPELETVPGLPELLWIGWLTFGLVLVLEGSWDGGGVLSVELAALGGVPASGAARAPGSGSGSDSFWSDSLLSLGL